MRLRGGGSALALVVALSGCAAWERSPEPVTAEAFEARMAELERRLDALAEADEGRAAGLSTLQGELGGLPEEVAAACRREAAESPPLAPACPPVEDGPLTDRYLLGRREWVRFPSLEVALEARVDTGANTSSLSATDITPFERDGEDWVRFRIARGEDHAVHPDTEPGEIERPVARTVTIIQASGEEERYVVTLPMELGPISERVEFTLNDRTDLSTPLLLGRRFFMDIALVDVGRKHIHGSPEEEPEAADDGGEED
ncbi:MAG: ATP-dependent zinc protease [Pseudomonadota bacterium]